jgi:hypothetical protein
MSKRAQKIANAMAAQAGVSKTFGSADYLPVAEAIISGLKPAERALNSILEANKTRLAVNSERMSLIPGMDAMQDTVNALDGLIPTEAVIKARTDRMVSRRLQDIDATLAAQDN